jgi:hypothetical protein
MRIEINFGVLVFFGGDPIGPWRFSDQYHDVRTLNETALVVAIMHVMRGQTRMAVVYEQER